MKRALSLFALLFIIAACNNEEKHPESNLHITGEIKGLKKGKLYIQQLRDTTLTTLDSIIVNGDATFDSYLNIDGPEMLYLFLDRGQTKSIDNSLPFFAEPGEMTINSTNENFFAKATITGSENHKMYEDYLKMKSRFTNKNLELIEQSMEAEQEGNTAAKDSIAEQMENLLKKRYLFTVNYAMNKGDYELAPYLVLSEVNDVNIVYLDTVQKSLSPKVAKSYYGELLKEYIGERRKTVEAAKSE